MPALSRPPTNVVREDIQLLDNLKASGNIALYEEVRAAVFEKHQESIGATMSEPMLTQPGSFEGSLHHPSVISSIPYNPPVPDTYYEGTQVGAQYLPEIPLNIGESAGPPIGGVAPGSIPALGDYPGPYFEGPQMGESQQPTTFSDLVNIDTLSKLPLPMPNILPALMAGERAFNPEAAMDNYPNIRAFPEGLVRGAADVAGMGLKAGQYIQNRLPGEFTPITTMGQVASVGEPLARDLEEKVRAFAPPPPESEISPFDKPEVLKDVFGWWIPNVGQMIPAQVLPIGTALKVGKWTKDLAPRARRWLMRGTVGGVAGPMEATQTYSQVLKETGSEEMAARAAEGMAVGTALLNTIGSMGWLAPAAKRRLMNMIVGGSVESVTEMTEELWEDLVVAAVTGKKVVFENILRQQAHVGPLAFLGGGAFAGVQKPAVSEKRSVKLAKNKIDKLARKYEIDSGELNFVDEPILDKQGKQQPGKFNPVTKQIDVHLDTIYRASDGTVSGVEATAAEIFFHEFIHVKTDARKKILNDIYENNHDAVDQWIQQSEYKDDKLDNAGKVDEWIANSGQGDYALAKRIELSVKDFINKRISKETQKKFWREDNTARELARKFVKGIKIEGATVEPIIAPTEEVVTEAGPELTVTEEVGAVSPELPVLPEQITDPTLEDTSFEDLQAAREATQVQLTQIEEQLDSVVRGVTGENKFAKPPVDIDRHVETAIAKATAPNKHIRYSDIRIESIKEDWENNKDNLDFRRDYANFEEFETREWDLNYDMWIDDVPVAEAEEADTTVTQLEVDPSIEELRATREAAQLQLTQLDEQLSGLERDFYGEPRFAKSASEMNADEIKNRNFRNFLAKGPYKAIAGRPDEVEIRGRLKRLGNIFGPYGQRRGIEFPGGIDEARSQAQNAIDQVDVFENFIAPLEKLALDKPAKSKTAEGRQEAYATRRNITITDILDYRERGKIHPMEKKMSYTFGMEEINRLEQEGEIRAEEAEARRRTLRELQNELAGRLPPGAKRKVTEIAFGIGDYANIAPWQMTEEETTATEARADLAKAKERVKGTRRTTPTKQQATETLEADITVEEAEQISMMAGSETFDHLKTDEARLTFLREEEAMSTIERETLNEFKKDPQAYDEAVFLAKRAADRKAKIAEAKFTVVEQTPAQRKAELAEMKEAQAPIEKRKHVQVEPEFFDTLVDTNFTMQGEAVPDGFMELTAEGEWSEVDDTDTSTRYAKVWGEEGEWVKHKVYGTGKIISIDEDAYSRRGATTIDFINILGSMVLVNVEEAKSVVEKNTRNIDELEKEYIETQEKLKLDEAIGKAPTRETMSASIKKILKADEYFKQDKFWHANDVSNVEEFAIRKNAQKLYELIEAKSAGTDIDRRVQESVSLSYKKTIGFLDRSRTILNKEIKTDKNKVPFVVDHSQELVTEMQRLHVAVGDFYKGRNVTRNQVLVINPMHVMKTNYNNIKEFGGGPQSERRDSDMSYTNMQTFMNSKSVQANLFNKKHAKDFGMEEQDLLTKVDDYLATTKAKDEGLMFSRLLKAHDGWYGTTSSAKAKETAEKLDAKLGEKEDGALMEEFEYTLTRYAKRSKGDSYEEHFNKSFWYTLTSYLWGKPVQAIRDFNKLSRFGQAKADIPAADEIADEVQRAHSSTQRAEALVYGTDIVQDTSIMTGQFYTRLAQIFSRVTARLGDIEKKENQILVDVLTGKARIEEIDNAETREAAKLLRELVQDVYNYAQEETKGLKKPLDLRGHGDTLLPRVWNIEFLATRRGKAKFLKAIRAAITDPATGSSILEDSELTVEDLFNVVVNSGGFVQGDWTNLKADQTRDQKEIDRDMRAQEYLDALPTESLIDEDLVMIDLQAIIPRFLQKAVERTEYSKRFGVNDELLRAKIKEGLEQIKVHNAKVLKLDKTDTSLTYIDPKAFEKSIWDMARILRNKYGYDMANMQTRAWLQRVVNFEVVAKLPLVTLASMPELFTPMLRGDVRADKWIVDLMMGLSWAGYKGMNGISKLLLNKHLPAMRKMSKDIGGIGVVSDIQLLRELGISEIQAMGDSVSTRYANPNFARGGLRAGASTTLAGRIPKKVRAVFNMQTYMQATLLITLTEMQQLMALRNFQRHMAKRVKFVQKNKDKELKGRRLRLFKQFSKDMADFGLPQNIDLSTPTGEAEFNAGAIRFVDQVITRPNDATTSKAFKNPLTAPIFLFKRFLTVFGNTLMTAVGNDIATKVDNVEKAKQVGRIVTTVVAMYGAVMFAEIMRGAIKGDLDEDDMTIMGGDFRTFVRRVDRTGLLSAPGAMLLNLSFPYKRGWWDSPEARIWGELGGPIGGDLSALMKTGFERRPGSAQRLIRQLIPMSKQLIDLPPKKKRSSTKKRTVLQQ